MSRHKIAQPSGGRLSFQRVRSVTEILGVGNLVQLCGRCGNSTAVSKSHHRFRTVSLSDLTGTGGILRIKIPNRFAVGIKRVSEHDQAAGMLHLRQLIDQITATSRVSHPEFTEVLLIADGTITGDIFLGSRRPGIRSEEHTDRVVGSRIDILVSAQNPGRR